MDVTLLGSGDAIGVPVPLCRCEYCRSASHRRRPALLVEASDTTLLLDAGSDVAEQLRQVGTSDLDAVALTHAHHDHSDGLHAIAQAGKWPPEHLESTEEFEPADDPVAPVYLTATAHDHLRETRRYLLPMLRTEQIAPRRGFTIGELQVTPFAVDHARPAFEMVGFVVESSDVRVVYAPDVREFIDDQTPADPDLLVVDGAALLGTPLHGPADVLRKTVETVDADRTVLVNVSEHKARQHTAALDRLAADDGCELGDDLTQYSV